MELPTSSQLPAVEGLEPRLVFAYFAAISDIPRCSKKEAALREYIASLATGRGYEHKTDSAGNLIVRVPGRGGLDSAPAVALQGHMDMVCEKNEETVHDFDKDGIKLRVVDDMLMGTHTTLGADNGIAVAMMLALLDTESAHPPLELLFTVDEESGLTGALNLDAGLISARRLINIDSEDEGVFTIGCAGGRNTEAEVPLETRPASAGRAFELTLTGLRGGHSGITIHEGRANAVSLGGRMLKGIESLDGIEVERAWGGDKHNAIPREFRIRGIAQPDALPKLRDYAARCRTEFLAEVGDIEPDLAVEFSEVDVSPTARSSVLTATSLQKLAAVLVALPHGVMSMSRAVPGMVESSTNLASANVEKGKLRILASQRSNKKSLVAAVAAKIEAVIRLAGGSAAAKSEYPGWAPNPDSTLLELFKGVYRERTGKDAVVDVVHAGLECGVIGERIPGMEMISFGPDIDGPHTPKEHVRIASVENSWNLLLDVLTRMK